MDEETERGMTIVVQVRTVAEHLACACFTGQPGSTALCNSRHGEIVAYSSGRTGEINAAFEREENLLTNVVTNPIWGGVRL